MIKLTAEGRQNEAAMPEKARKTINWVPVLDSPQASVEMPCRKHPIRNISRLPTTSDIDPHINSVQPHVSEYMVTGLDEQNTYDQRLSITSEKGVVFFEIPEDEILGQMQVCGDDRNGHRDHPSQKCCDSRAVCDKADDQSGLALGNRGGIHFHDGNCW